ncbi:MAG: putative Ig domain-containing protein [PVC group bacterium]
MRGLKNIYNPPFCGGRYILTPPPPKTPRINGPAVFGVRPGAPFLFTIPASGERPMSFSAKGLLKGLRVDENTGRITGRIESVEKKSSAVTLRAFNRHGRAEKRLRIAVGDDVCLTPPLGWNSWNAWGQRIDREKALASARAMVEKGLINHGWTYVNIDDGWQGTRGGPYHAIQPDPEKFSDMVKMCDTLHSLGLKAGIYSTPWITTYAGRAGGSSDSPAGVWEAKRDGRKQRVFGKYGFHRQDARQWAEWGIDYLKYDWYPNDLVSVRRMAKALRECGRDIVYSISSQAPLRNTGTVRKHASCWRTTGDLKDRWNAAGPGLNMVEVWNRHREWLEKGGGGGPGHFPDADMLVVGPVIEDNASETPRPSRLTPDEQYTHISLWALWSSPMLIGCPVEMMDEFTVGLLINDEVLAVHQDPAGFPGKTVFNEDNSEIIVKKLSDGSVACGLFNRHDEARMVTAGWDLIGLSGERRLRDIWRQKDIGTYDRRFSARVRPHGTILIRAMRAN